MKKNARAISEHTWASKYRGLEGGLPLYDHYMTTATEKFKEVSKRLRGL